MVWRSGLAVLVLLLWCDPSGASERWTPDGDSCGHEATTNAIAGCIDARAKVWDQRLNQAYQALMTMLKDERPRADALKVAQRAWLAYRNANCAFYETESGTIRMIEVATCKRDLTETRAIELQQAGPN